MRSTDTHKMIISCTVLFSSIVVSLVLLSSASEAQSALSRYPQQVEVEELFLLAEDEWKEKDGSSLPFINSRHYLRMLALSASLPVIKSAVMVVGPKNSGKSKALQLITPHWEKLGHIVLDVDLKGCETLLSRNVMWHVVERITRAIYSLDYQAQQCVLDKLFDYSMYMYNHRQYVILNFIYSGFSTPHYICLSGGIGVGILYVVTMLFTNSIVKLLPMKILLVLSVFLVLLGLLCYIVNWYITEKVIMNPIEAKIASGDWDALSYSCNVISICAPERRPILILRELTNLDSDSLNTFLRPLERMKQGDLHYPVFAESSNFLWMRTSPVTKSSDSFVLYDLQEMTQEEGLAEVVHRFKIWTEEEYDLIYSKIGGHLGSFSLLYDYNKVQKLSLNASISHLKERAYMLVHEAVVRAGRGSRTAAVKDWLVSFKNSGYRATAIGIPEDIQMLFEMNILFRDLGYVVYPQNKLLERAIDEYICEG